MTTLTAPRGHRTATTATTSRRTAVAVALLFLTATATFLAADTLLGDVLGTPDLLADASAHAPALGASAVLAFVCGLAVVAIAVLLYPVLRPHSEPLALGYVGLRVAELAAILLYLAVPLLVTVLGDGLAAGTVEAGDASPLVASLDAQYDVAVVMVYLFTSTAGTVLAVALHRSGLVPRPLALLGLVGYPVLLVGSVLHVFGLTDVTRGAGLLAVAPGGLFELVLPIWLLGRGFAGPGRGDVPADDTVARGGRT